VRQVTEDGVLRGWLLAIRQDTWCGRFLRRAARRERPTLREQVEWALLPAFL